MILMIHSKNPEVTSRFLKAFYDPNSEARGNACNWLLEFQEKAVLVYPIGQVRLALAGKIPYYLVIRIRNPILR